MFLRIITSLLITITITKVTIAQISLSLGNVKANSGETVNIPLNVTNFNNVGAISIKIEYDTSVLTNFIGLVNLPPGRNFNTFVSGGVLTIGWFDVSSNPINIGNSKLCDLVFQYSNGTSSLNFITQLCEISNSNGQPFSLTFQNGSVSPLSGVDEQVTAIDGFLISEFYPNPFNGTTRIKIKLDKTENISIDIFDLLGNLVCNVLSNKSFYEGEHIIELSDLGIKNSSSVSYYCIIRIGESSRLIRKVIYIK